MGKRQHSKEQLRIDEAHRWQAKAIEFADRGEDGTIAAMMCLLMGMRCSEVVSRVVRDLDDEGRLGATLDAVLVHAPRGPRRPVNLCLDKGYDYADPGMCEYIPV